MTLAGCGNGAFGDKERGGASINTILCSLELDQASVIAGNDLIPVVADQNGVSIQVVDVVRIA